MLTLELSYVWGSLRTQSEERFYLVLVPPVALLAAFANYTKFHGYAWQHPEVWICVGGIFFVRLLAGVVLAAGSRLTTAVLMAALATLILDLLFAFWDWRSTLLLVPFLGALVVSWLLSEHLAKVALVVVGTTLIATILFPVGEWNIPAFDLDAESATSEKDLPPFVHIVLDGHIGISGITDDLEGAAEIRESISTFYRSRDFQIFPNAYSHYFNTQDSVPNLLNFTTNSTKVFYFETFHPGESLRSNRYFKLMADKGYRLHIYQTDYIDFCAPQESSLTSCQSFPGLSIRGLEGIQIPAVQKAIVIANQFIELSYMYKTIRQFYRETLRPWLTFDGFTLPDWTWRGRDVFPITGLSALETLKSDFLRNNRSSFYFAHVGLPHEPYIYNRECNPRPTVGDWVDRSGMLSRTERFFLYLGQLECTYERLQALFDTWDEARLLGDAVILIHGDHGSRTLDMAPTVKNAGLLSKDDYSAAFSTLFAARLPTHANIGIVTVVSFRFKRHFPRCSALLGI